MKHSGSNGDYSRGVWQEERLRKFPAPAKSYGTTIALDEKAKGSIRVKLDDGEERVGFESESDLLLALGAWTPLQLNPTGASH